jgi:mono/diheme cytochrome c family protein
MNYRMPGLHKIAVLVLFTFSIVITQAQEISKDPAVAKQGEALFNLNCKSCHKIDKKLAGPALAGFDARVPSIPWAIEWVKNSSKMIASGDAYAVKIYDEYKSQMTAFTTLKDEEILSIFAYVKAEEVRLAEAAKAQPDPTLKPGSGGEGVPSGYINLILIGLVVILVLLLVVLGFIVTTLKKFLDQKDLSEEDKEIVNNPITAGSFFSSPGFIFLVTFIVAAVGFKTTVDGLYTIGVQQGYQPKQPIAFSHKVHAGQYEIDCKYCHTGTIKGKSANIPSPNICMNCHSQIKSGTTTGEGEIAKIYKAIQDNKPIEWVRIHNLPDLAYFNHQQHVVVGGIECQTCHGPIQEMDVVKQYSLLTMGWCIDCHRKTDVNSKGNEYYDKLVKLHDEKKTGKMKVEDIGGLECSKCHY